MKRCLVTGAAGFVGFHLARRLLKYTEADVLLVDAFRHGPPDPAYESLARSPRASRIDGDLCDASFVSELPEVDVVYHLAALNGTDNFYNEPWKVVRDCTLPTVNLLERYRCSSLSRWVYTSSSEVYAESIASFGWEIPTDESVPMSFRDVLNPRWSYGASKAHGEIATVAAFRDSNVDWTILRLHNVFGPRMGRKHFIPDFICRLMAGEFWLLGADQTRAYAYIDDVISQIQFAGTSPETAGEILNVGSMTERLNEDVALLIMDLMDVSGPLELRPALVGSVSRRCPDMTRMRSLRGSLSETSFEQGLKSTIDWYRDGTLADDA